jgi:hypothetical protein
MHALVQCRQREKGERVGGGTSKAVGGTLGRALVSRGKTYALVQCSVSERERDRERDRERAKLNLKRRSR